MNYSLRVIDYKNKTKVYLSNAYNIQYRDIFGNFDELSFQLTFYQYDGFGNVVLENDEPIENYANEFIKNENIIELTYGTKVQYMVIKNIDIFRSQSDQKIISVECLEKAVELTYKDIPILDLSPSNYNPTRVDATISNILSSKFSLGEDNVVSTTSNTITLGTTASSTSDEYNGMYICIIDGAGQGQTFRIIDYNGSTKTVTLDDTINETIDTSSIYRVYNFTWRVGNIDNIFLNDGTSDIKRYYLFENETIIESLLKVANRLGGCLKYRYVFDEIYQEFVNYVDLVKPNTYSNKEIRYNKNLVSSRKNSESESQIYTRLFVYGDGNLTLNTYPTVTRTDNGVTYNEHENGQSYIENYQYYLELGYDIEFCRKNFVNDKSITDGLYVTQEDLFQFGKDKLDSLSIPKLTYEISYVDLNDALGYEYEEFESGDTIRVYDDELKLNFYATVIEKPVRLDIINKSSIILQNQIEDLGDYFNKVIDLIKNI